MDSTNYQHLESIDYQQYCLELIIEVGVSDLGIFWELKSETKSKSIFQQLCVEVIGGVDIHLSIQSLSVELDSELKSTNFKKPKLQSVNYQ